MARYARETHYYDDGGFATVGRIVDVLSHSPHNDRITVLVEKPDPTNFSGDGSSAPERVNLYEAGTEEPVDSIEIDDEPRKLTFFCNATKSDGGRCTREVEEAGDTCWQHTMEGE